MFRGFSVVVFWGLFCWFVNGFFFVCLFMSLVRFIGWLIDLFFLICLDFGGFCCFFLQDHENNIGSHPRRNNFYVFQVQ